MKKLTPKFWIQQLPTNNMAAPRAPKPFPGKWPTRLIVSARWKRRRSQDAWQRFEYFGKPSPNIIRRVSVLVKNPNFEGQVRYCEVDLTGPIADGNRYIPHPSGIDACATGHWNEKLYRFYHPWGWQNYTLLPAFNHPFFSKRIKFHGKCFTVYSPHPKLKIEDHVRPFKTWLEKSGILGV